MSRSKTLGLSLACVSALVVCNSRSDQARLNVLLITLDTTRADHLSCYGYSLPTSPRLDGLALEGTLFTRCMSTSSLTPVSHASILSGLEPQQHGLRVLHAGSGDRLPDSVPTLATILAREGWRTAAVLSAFPVSERFGLERGFEHFDNGMSPEPMAQAQEEAPPRRGLDAPRGARQRRSDATTDEAIAWLRQGGRPFFLWVHYWDPHDPILVPPEHHVRGFMRDVSQAGAPPPELYDIEIHYMDRQIGRLLDALTELGVEGQTMVVVTADHGEGLGEHGWPSHRLLYQEQIHVPLIVRLPGRGAGRVVDALVRTTDIHPTVLEALGVEAPIPVAGLGLRGLLDGIPEPGRVAYAESLIKWDTRAGQVREQRPEDDDLLHCLMDASTKLIYRPLHPERSELYDLLTDPDEARNLFEERGFEARALLDQLLSRDAFLLEPLGEADLDLETSRALRGLGYAGDE